MALALGVDTGGTYTDAVLIRDEREVLAKAKSLTTRQDLAIGIGRAVTAVLETSGIRPQDVALAALSTTLATNALVEGHGGRVALVFIGFRDQDLQTHGLTEALGGEPVLVLPGGHSHAGEEVAPLDLDALAAWATDQDVTAFAVAAQFATRNPAHELAARDVLARTGRPVTCSHELSAKLGGPKRALTALLNARLIGMTHRLIGEAQSVLRAQGIAAPLMVVRGDGALMSAEVAQDRPIETILSGPAASIVGARWLTGAQDALVSDIGGTTTDIALLRQGRPALDPEGARVGPYRTMVEAVAMRTHGLGGDSDVTILTEGLSGGVRLGPGRVVPVSLAASMSDTVLADMEMQLRRAVPSEQDARFAFRLRAAGPGLSPRETTVLERLTERPQPMSAVLKTRLDGQALRNLVRRGIAQIAGVTPSDAVHALGRADHWNAEAATLALRLLARRRVGTGDTVAEGPQALARMIIDQMTQQTSDALLEAALAEEGWDAPADLARHPLLRKAITGHTGLLSLSARVSVPVIGLGASAACYYPAIGQALGAPLEVPEHAGVANAIGAVVGRVIERASATITSPSEGLFRAHLPDGPRDFADKQAALAHVNEVLAAAARAAAEASGAEEIAVHVHQEIKTAEVEAREVFVEAILRAEASGRPRVA